MGRRAESVSRESSGVAPLASFDARDGRRVGDVEVANGSAGLDHLSWGHFVRSVRKVGLAEQSEKTESKRIDSRNKS